MTMIKYGWESSNKFVKSDDTSKMSVLMSLLHDMRT